MLCRVLGLAQGGARTRAALMQVTPRSTLCVWVGITFLTLDVHGHEATADAKQLRQQRMGSSLGMKSALGGTKKLFEFCEDKQKLTC